MAPYDKKIKDMLKKIGSKRETLGDKPRAAWKTNCIFKKGNTPHVNINVINSVEDCIIAVGSMVNEESGRDKAAKLLGVEGVITSFAGFCFNDWVHDFKLKASMLNWDIEKKKLNFLEEKLSDLRSEDAKTEDALEDIMSELN